MAGATRLALAHGEDDARYQLANVSATPGARAMAGRSHGSSVSCSGRPRPTTCWCRPASGARGRRCSWWRQAPRCHERLPDMDNQRAADVRLVNVAVDPRPALLGPEGGALPGSRKPWISAPLLLCAEAVGAMGFANDTTLEYLKTRKQFGVAIGVLPGIATPHRGHGDDHRAGALYELPGLLQGRYPDRSGDGPCGLGGQDQGGRCLPPGVPGGGADARRHRDDGGAQGLPHLPASDHDRPAIRRCGLPPRAFCRLDR